MGEYTEPLAELRWHYGEAYAIRHPGPDTWLAQRRDDRTVLRSDSAEGLLEKIRADYAERPVPRQYGGGGQPSARSRFTVEG